MGTGNVFVLQHSFFQNVVKFACSQKPAEVFAEGLTSALKMPGQFSVLSTTQCSYPCDVKARVEKALMTAHYVEDFFEVSPEFAIKIIKRESMRIPVIFEEQ